MRIRRYAARLLASSTSTAPSSSPPPQPPPGAPWCHSAADDCAFCELSRSAPQVAPDAIKQKGHIAGRAPESELTGDAHGYLASRPPVPEDQGCKVDDGAPARKAIITGLGASGFGEAMVIPEGSGGASVVSEGANGPGDRRGASVANADASEQEDRGGTCSSDESADVMGVTGAASHVNGAIDEPQVLRGVPRANVDVSEPLVSVRVLSACEAAREQGFAVFVPGVAGRAPLDGEGAAELEITKDPSLVNGAIDEPEVLRGAPPANVDVSEPLVSVRVLSACEAASEQGFAIFVPGVAGRGPLDGEGAAELEITKDPSLVNESAAKMEVTRDSPLVNETGAGAELRESVSVVCEAFSGLNVIGVAVLDNEGATEQEVTGGASLVNEAPEMAVKGGAYISNGAAAQLDITGRGSAEPEVTGGASDCCGDGNATLDEPSPDCNSEIANMPTAENVVPHGGCIDVTPSDSCLSDIVSRSIGKSGRTDLICYTRRRGKRKLEMEIKKEKYEMDDGAIVDQHEEKVILERTVPCESATSAAVSIEIKLADIKRELEDNSTASKGKKKKIHRFECEIDYCGMAFKTRAELSLHKKNTCTVKSCNRRFRAHNYLKRHQSVHNDEMHYKCPWEGCSMAFKQSWDRGEHFKIHTGQKPYKCTTSGCSKTFKFVSDFIRHKRRCKPRR